MPMPTPTPDESKDDFIARCVADQTMNAEYPDNAQRFAVCQAQWSEDREGKFTPGV
jgi:hypothetical protein